MVNKQLLQPPAVRALGTAIRSLRKQRGHTQAVLAEALGVSVPVISRLERGGQWPSQLDLHDGVSRMLRFLQPSPADQQLMMDLAAQADQPHWLAFGAMVPKQLAELMRYETMAKRSTTVSLILIPGMLQTRAYTLAVLSVRWQGPELDAMLAVRMQRTELLQRPTPKTFLVDESALRRRFGGPAVLREQLEHLRAVSELDHVELRVIPSDSSHIVAAGGSYTYLEFDGQPPIVHVDHAGGGMLGPKGDDFGDLTARLRDTTLSPAGSVALIDAVAATL